MKILIFGISGMVGSTIYRYFSQLQEFSTFGTLRNADLARLFSYNNNNIITDVDAYDHQNLKNIFVTTKPDIVINCIGAIKQLEQGNQPISAISLNSLFPHVLAAACANAGSRLIHISTDCVFSGKLGNYKESDIPDAQDIYGRSKLLGEVNYSPCLTLRTSVIGHELNSNKSLISWFLSQTNAVDGYARAMYSGVPAIELATIIEKIIKNKFDLTGLYHVAANPIAKYELLTLVKKVYKKPIKINKNEDFVCNKTLDATIFNKIMGYTPPSWLELIEKMYYFEQKVISNA